MVVWPLQRLLPVPQADGRDRPEETIVASGYRAVVRELGAEAFRDPIRDRRLWR